MNTYSPQDFEQELELFNKSLEDSDNYSQTTLDNYPISEQQEYTKQSRLRNKRVKKNKHEYAW